METETTTLKTVHPSQEIRTNVDNLALSVIVPTRNEAENVDMLLQSIRQAIMGTNTEVIFVDDSTDDTPAVVNAAIGKFPELHVRLIHRTGEERTGGLGGAVVVGLQAAQAEYACVMDGDLQHPPSLLPVLLKTAIDQQVDLVVATRRSQASEVSGLNTVRNLISKTLDLIARGFFPRQLRGVSDPLTGFFLVRVDSIAINSLRPKGFKILLEILVRNPSLKKGEVPFHFGERFAGQSKASAKEAFKYLSLLWSLRFGESSLRFMGFALVGLSGVFINSLVLYLATDLLQVYYLVSAAIATVVSTIWNFGLTESFVYQGNSGPTGRLKRIGWFFVINMVALALRAPLIYLLTSVLGIYYIISNLVSLAVLLIARFALADNFIWAQPKPGKPIAVK
jgi:dolichol-phosphate mannosyltransferase